MSAAPQFKVVVCGRAGVGKTSLLHATDPAARVTPPQPTIGVEFITRTITVADGRRVCLQFWDTAGQERFGAPTALVYRNATAIIFVYAITDRDSFMAMEHLLGAALAVPNARSPYVIIIGNKLDLASTQRAVTTAESEEGCRARNYSLLETSAHTRENVDEMLNTLAEELLARFDRTPPAPVEHVRLRLAGTRIDAPSAPPRAQCNC